MPHIQLHKWFNRYTVIILSTFVFVLASCASDELKYRSGETVQLDPYPNRVFGSHCENSQLPALMSYVDMPDSVSDPRYEDERGLCVLDAHLFGRGRFHLELMARPEVDEIWLVGDDELDPLLSLQRSALKFVGRAAGGLERDLVLRPGGEIRVRLGVEPGRARVETDGPEWSWDLDASGPYRIAVPTSEPNCNRCVLLGFDIWLDDTEARRWYESLGDRIPMERRLRGLDRLVNFSPIVDLGGEFDRAVNTNIASRLLPDLLLPSKHAETARLVEFENDDGEPSAPFEIRDFQIPSYSALDRMVIRQVIDRAPYSRIHPQYWAVYNNGRRTECWKFVPDPQLPGAEDKFLAPYEIENVSQVSGISDLVFRTCGAMFRPGGLAWVQRKDFLFSYDDNDLNLELIVGPVYIAFNEDGSASIKTESVGGEGESATIAVRSAKIDPAQLEQCGIPDVHIEKLSCEAYVEAAACLLGERPETTYRALTERSWVEIGGGASGRRDRAWSEPTLDDADRQESDEVN